MRPRALAVLRLMTSSNLVGRSNGKPPGVAPLRILSTKVAASVQTLPIVSHVDTMFATEAEANAYAVEMAKKWIDERG